MCCKRTFTKLREDAADGMRVYKVTDEIFNEKIKKFLEFLDIFTARLFNFLLDFLQLLVAGIMFN